MKIPLSSINIGPRQRLDLGDLSDLDSMGEPDVGQVCPITVCKTLSGYDLVAGRRRIAKATALGWTHIEAWDKDQLTEKQKQLQEFFEDYGRKERTWQETCIATKKLFAVMRNEKREEGEVWTVRSMALFCGDSKSTVAHRIAVADALSIEPHDQELWSCDGFMPAVKLLAQRSNSATSAEMERRRLAAAQAAVPTVEGELPLAEGAVQSLDTTAEAPTRIRLNGLASEFTGSAAKFPLIITYFVPEHVLFAVAKSVAPNGYLVAWTDAKLSVGVRIREVLPEFNIAPFLLIWNRNTPTDETWPFYSNLVYGQIACNGTPVLRENEPCRNAVLSIFHTGPGLARQVTQQLCEMLSTDGQAVLCLGDVEPQHVAEAGRVPVFYEPDKAAFDAKVAALREYYETNVPNVEVVGP